MCGSTVTIDNNEEINVITDPLFLLEQFLETGIRTRKMRISQIVESTLLTTNIHRYFFLLCCFVIPIHVFFALEVIININTN